MKSRPRHAVLVSRSKDPFVMLDFSVSAIKNKIREQWRPSMLEMLEELVAHAFHLPPLPFPRGPGNYINLYLCFEFNNITRLCFEFRPKFC